MLHGDRVVSCPGPADTGPAHRGAGPPLLIFSRVPCLLQHNPCHNCTASSTARQSAGPGRAGIGRALGWGVQRSRYRHYRRELAGSAPSLGRKPSLVHTSLLFFSLQTVSDSR